jgi:Ras GTPase-activating-like protein IQGAP2/3
MLVAAVFLWSPVQTIDLFSPQRMALDEREEVREHLEETDEGTGDNLDDRRMQVRNTPLFFFVPDRLAHNFLACQQYANLFFLLQSEPRHVASLCRLVSLSEIDTLLQTVMFTLYGNQYESREEHLLLTMFQVRGTLLLRWTASFQD